MRHFYTVFFWLLLYCFSLLFLSIIYRGSTKFSRIESFIFRDVKQNNKGFYSFFECNRLDEEKSEGKMKMMLVCVSKLKSGAKSSRMKMACNVWQRIIKAFSIEMKISIITALMIIRMRDGSLSNINWNPERRYKFGQTGRVNADCIFVCTPEKEQEN